MSNFKLQKNIDLLHPWLAERCISLLGLVQNKLPGYYLKVTETLRSAELQNKYFKEKKTKFDGYKLKSLHQLGLAFDCALFVNGKITWNTKLWKPITPLAQSLNLEHGLSWTKFIDAPHFQPSKVILVILKNYINANN